MASKSTVARKRPAAGAADAQSPDKPLLAADRIRRTARKCSIATASAPWAWTPSSPRPG